MRCFYCGKQETCRNPFYNLDNDGHKICQSCMREGHAKSALEIIEHNKKVDNPCYGCIYENIDDTTENISKCVCCKRNVDYAKNDYYMRKEDEGKCQK